jgi:8-oxo-dGTP pyrophosphatase MutT (NUDIX family)
MRAVMIVEDERQPDRLKLPGIGPLLHLYWRFSRGLTLGVRAVVIDERDRVFLIRHTYAEGWHFPGGGVEPGETAIEAMRRELREEARIEAAADPPLHGVFFNTRVSRRDHVIVYVVRAFRVIEAKEPDREIAAAGFFPIDDLPTGVTGGTRARLDEIADGGHPSPFW